MAKVRPKSKPAPKGRVTQGVRVPPPQNRPYRPALRPKPVQKGVGYTPAPPRPGYTPPMARTAHAPVAALHTSAKSGYAKDVMPDRVAHGMAGAAIPIASASGRQEGRIPPSERQYGVAQYDVVDAEEALLRMSQRIKGTLPVIAGGLDDNTAVVATGSGELDAFEPGMNNGYAEPEPEEVVHPEPRPVMRQFAPVTQVKVATPPPVSPIESYLNKRVRLAIELPDTTLNVAATDVIVSRCGILVLLPTAGGQSTFVPKPGAEVTLAWGDKSYKCYFPGGAFELEVLGLLGLSFIRADE